MDEVVVAFGTALVQAVATDSWAQIRDAVTGLWRRTRGGQPAEDIGSDLDTLRAEVLEARAAGDQDIEDALTGEWRSRLRRLLRTDPDLAVALREVLDQVLTPALQPAEQARVQTLLGDHGQQVHIAAGNNAYTALGDQTNIGGSQTNIGPV
ncbi:hypothetical protein [Jidongwangia harbinensis]|uniref:hypothetical protein n=1 Tax=Jidongwangia harbinensis TaxID=2878561 RepID=UPI001CDA3FF5|nr:hypothetical protein [Jidongwangia harbinensis]MCA2216309.1 hypothetical protein [Jidongwangia harbinensis]MCA2217044.1 hypothetical protein [Jidongwangia harbinensis]